MDFSRSTTAGELQPLTTGFCVTSSAIELLSIARSRASNLHGQVICRNLLHSGRQPEVRKIWFSLYTPQAGERTDERLSPQDRAKAIAELVQVREVFPKVELTNEMLEGFLHPVESPEECIFAQVTTCLSADLKTLITPCQLGGRPVCKECGCLASAGLTGIGRHKLGGLVQLSDVLAASERIGRFITHVALGLVCSDRTPTCKRGDSSLSLGMTGERLNMT